MRLKSTIGGSVFGRSKSVAIEITELGQFGDEPIEVELNYDYELETVRKDLTALIENIKIVERYNKGLQ